ncbi:MAG: Spo0E family sporulation regulatory protein-aspartic acid phosphatase [Bacillota bacterium]
MDKKELLTEIERVRQELHQLIDNRKNIDEQAVKKSEELDRLLNEFQKLDQK